MKVCMFVYNNCKNDSRVLKEAGTLARSGYDVRIIALLDNITEPYEERDGFKIIRVIKDPLHYKVLRTAKSFSFLHLFKPLKSFAKWSFASLGKFIYFRSLFLGKLQGNHEGQNFIKKGSDVICRLRQAFSEIDLSLKEQGPKRYIKHIAKTKPCYSIFLGLAILLGYYTARKANKGLRRIKRLFRTIQRKAKRGLRRFFRRVKNVFLSWLKSILMIFHRPLCFLDYYYRSFQLVKSDPADIYHAHDLNTLPVAYFARRFSGGKLVYDSHELYTEISSFSRGPKLAYTLLEKLLIGHADSIITVNESIAGELSERYGVPGPCVVMNCPETNGVRSFAVSGCNLIREKLRLKDSIPVVLYQGGYTSNRGLENLLNATQYLEWGIMAFMGWGKLEEELRRLVERLSLEEKVYFLNPVSPDQLLEWTSSANLGVIPYQFVGLNNYYSTPNKLFEYINAGLPVVGSGFPELKKIIEGYRLGETFDPENPEDIAKAINSVLSERRQYDEMKKNALMAAKIFNWENESKKLLELYKSLGSNL